PCGSTAPRPAACVRSRRRGWRRWASWRARRRGARRAGAPRRSWGGRSLLLTPEPKILDMERQECRDDDMLTKVQLEAALNVSTRTIDRWIREGTGPP